MKIVCEAEKLFPNIEKLIKKLSEKENLTKKEDACLRDLLRQYWNIECPLEGKYCLPNYCSFARPENWIEYHGYTCMADLLRYFEFEESEEELKLEEKESIDTMDAHWARRQGHYNP